MNLLSFDIGINNLAFCYGQYNPEIKKFNILKWNKINLEFCCEEQCTQKIKYIDLLHETYKCKYHIIKNKLYHKHLKNKKKITAELIIVKLNKIFKNLQNIKIHITIIENQLGHKAQKNKQIQNYIEMYCNLKLNCKKIYNCHPKNKFFFLNKKVLENYEKKNAYKNKENIIMFILNYLKKIDDKINLNKIKIFKKKDDLADSLILILFYLNKFFNVNF